MPKNTKIDIDEKTTRKWDEQVEAKTGWCNYLQSAEWASVKSGGRWHAKKVILDATESIPVVLYSRLLPGFGRVHYVPKLATLSPERAGEFTVKLQNAAGRGVSLRLEIDQPFDESLHAALLRQGWHESHKIQYDTTVQVNLRPLPESILAGFKKRARYEITVAKRNGVAAEQVPLSEETMHRAYEMLNVTARRANFLNRSKKFTYDYWKTLFDSGQGYLYEARHDGELLAVAFIIRIGKRAYYKDGGSIRKKNTMFASRYLQWQIMQDMKSLGCDTYELCGVLETADTKAPDYGIYVFKTGFGDAKKLQGGYVLPLGRFRFVMWRKLEPKLMLAYTKIFKDFWY